MKQVQKHQEFLGFCHFGYACPLFLPAYLLTGIGWLYYHWAAIPRAGLLGLPCASVETNDWHDFSQGCTRLLHLVEETCEEQRGTDILASSLLAGFCDKMQCSILVECLREMCEAKMERTKPTRAPSRKLDLGTGLPVPHACSVWCCDFWWNPTDVFHSADSFKVLSSMIDDRCWAWLWLSELKIGPWLSVKWTVVSKDSIPSWWTVGPFHFPANTWGMFLS